MQINDCTNCFVELHSHMQDFFTCKEVSVAMFKVQNLSLKKMCPLDLMQENSTKKNDNGDEHRVCCFHCELIARKHKTNNYHPLPTLTKNNIQKNKKNNKQVNKEIFLTYKEVSVSNFINVKSYKKEIKNFNPKKMHPFILLQENIKKKTKNHDNKHGAYHQCHNLVVIIIKENKQQ